MQTSSLGEKNESCPVVFWNSHRHLSGSGVPLPKYLDSSEGVVTKTVLNTPYAKGEILLLERRNKEIWVVLWVAFLEIPIQGLWRQMKWCVLRNSTIERRSIEQGAILHWDY